MRVVVQVVGGPSANKRFVLQRGQEATFGRTQNADHAFPEDPRMSSVHFSLRLTDAGCLVRDHNSTNGTYVDDQRVIERNVASGSTIRAGDTRFSVTLAEIALAQFTGPGSGIIPPAGSTAANPSPGTAGNSAAGINAAAALTGVPAPKPVLPQPASPMRPASPIPPSAVGATLRTDDPTPRITEPAPATQKWRSLAGKEYEIAVDDEDAIVRRNALLAATWKGQKWVLEWCRQVSTNPDPKHWDGFMLLAILGQSEDLARVQALGFRAELGPERFALLGAYGHPRVLGDLLACVGVKDDALAFAARTAYTKITGLDVPLKKAAGKAQTPPAFDSDAAVLQCQQLERQFPGAFRLCRGHDISRGVSPELLPAFDLESRWEACLRGRFNKTWKATPLDLPQLGDALISSL